MTQSPVQQTGLQANDTVVSVDGKPLSNTNTLHDAVLRADVVITVVLNGWR